MQRFSHINFIMLSDEQDMKMGCSLVRILSSSHSKYPPQRAALIISTKKQIEAAGASVSRPLCCFSRRRFCHSRVCLAGDVCLGFRLFFNSTGAL